jgi:hypothetical protein
MRNALTSDNPRTNTEALTTKDAKNTKKTNSI